MPDSPTSPIIDVRNLRKSYGTKPVLHDVSFAVGRGETLCLLGPNGAGKTTTVEILEGFRTRDGGVVEVLGLDPATRRRDLVARMGMVHQSCGVHEELSARELLSMFSRYYPAAVDVDELLAMVDLEPRSGARIGTLSGGQRRRLDMALALVGKPEVLILDEPTTGFDPGARRQAWDIVRRLCSGGVSVLLTTHMMDEAQALADRIVVLAGGVIIASGTPDELGGRDQAATEIRFTMPAGYGAGDLPELPGASVRQAGDTVVIATTSATDCTAQLIAWADGEGVKLAGLHVTQPSLEDTYLALIEDRGLELK